PRRCRPSGLVWRRPSGRARHRRRRGTRPRHAAPSWSDAAPTRRSTSGDWRAISPSRPSGCATRGSGGSRRGSAASRNRRGWGRGRAELRTLLGHAAHERTAREAAEQAATAQASSLAQRAAAQARATVQAADELERARRRVAELKEQEMRGRAIRRQTEEALAQLTARRDALAELERERVGLAPAAQALLNDRGQSGDAVVGPLADFVRASHRDAALAERLLGDWPPAVLVRDAAATPQRSTGRWPSSPQRKRRSTWPARQPSGHGSRSWRPAA